MNPSDVTSPAYTQAQRKVRRLRALLIIVIAMLALCLFALVAVTRPAEAAAGYGPKPPRPDDTQRIAPPPPGRRETLLYCRHFLQPGQAARRAECRRANGYR